MSMVKVLVSGVAGLQKQLRKAEQDTLKAVRAALYKGGRDIRNTAVLSIVNGPKSGTLYGPIRTVRLMNRGVKVSKGRAAKTHRASAPGEAPAADTGNLHRNIHVATEKGGDVVYVYVSNNAPYGKWLEFGTTGIAARPFLRPAFNKHAAAISAHIKAAYASGGAKKG